MNEMTDIPTMQIGENGTPEYTNEGVGSKVLALSQMVRGAEPGAIADQILLSGSTQDVADLILLLFATRNTRGGKGEKKLAYEMFLRVWKQFPKTARVLLKLFPHYGYWKDLLLMTVEAKESKTMTNADVEQLMEATMELMKQKLLEDIAAEKSYQLKLAEATEEEEIDELKKKGPQISLLAKWLPREGSSLDKKTGGFVGRFARLVWPDLGSDDSSTSWESAAKATYRRVIAQLTSYMGLPEVLLALQREEEIQFERLASKATMRLTKTFLNQNKKQQEENHKRIKLAERFSEFVLDKKYLKGSQLMPHEIVAKIMRDGNMSAMEEQVLDALWKDLWRNVVKQTENMAKEQGDDFNPTRMVPLADVSGSMSGLPMEVSIAMSIGISEISHDAFKNMVLTFESNPRWHMLNANDTIVQKVRSLQRAPWGGSTNFEKAYDLILQVAVKAKLPREDLPCLIVFSDMQFDQAAGYHSCSSRYPTGQQTMYQVFRKKTKQVAKQLQWSDAEPTPIVFWNLRNTGGHPVDKDTEGTVLLAGFSPSLLKLVMYGEALKEEEIEVVLEDGTVVTKKIRVTPGEILRKMLDDKLYDPVRELLHSSLEGKLLEYEIPDAEAVLV